MTPAMLVPTPQGLFQWGCTKKLLGSGGRQPGRDNSHGKRRIVKTKNLTECLEYASSRSNIVSSEEKGGSLIAEIPFKGKFELLSPICRGLLP
jgi:hypothetical protein